MLEPMERLNRILHDRATTSVLLLVLLLVSLIDLAT